MDTLYTSPWKYFEALHFLSDAFKPSNTCSNVVDSAPYNASNPPSSKSAKTMKENKNDCLKSIMTSASTALEKLVSSEKRTVSQIM